MAFFTDNFLNARRTELMRAVNRFQYRRSGVWYDGEINSKEIQDTDVVVFVNIPGTGTATTITGVRVYDRYEALAGQQDINLSLKDVNSGLVRFTFPLVEKTTT